ncbi:uncharacterized protein BX663DRAFT_501500 [Cokeromyces recurvatus]|uniref:uncharacterized protein n=1 Tax=Cokeromyces recurvatus TaxID=90255 RepID=UPI00221F6C19|nr:uncharacterized protein BX663DRAFT_501500 [Cokeromyces recurvatus]KAI7905044.1 hypothetical protein BX663DRAFT_501500 [Cokeromyces recurvatus]
MSQETATIDPEHTTTTYQNYFTTASNHSNNTKKREESIRPCIHCQKALLTCDEGRPCQGCIKRDLSTTCFDGIRKKPKINYTTTANNSKCK